MKTKRQRQEEALLRREDDYQDLLMVSTLLEKAVAGKYIDIIRYGKDTFLSVSPYDPGITEVSRTVVASKINAALRDIANLKAKLN